jgi:dTDP-4-amino-4,6-dideoxygalactose transaminase
MTIGNTLPKRSVVDGDMNPVPLFKVHMPTAVNDALGRTLASGYIAHGAKVSEFESGLGLLLGTSQLCAVTDASAGLTLALFLSGVRPGDEVVTSPLSCLATVMPIANLFAKPVWCDIDPDTGMPNASHIGRQVTERTRAVIVYYWSGNPTDIESLRPAAPSAKFVADASEAFGAEIGCKPLALAKADFTIYSFSAVRHVTTGEGGALVAAAREDHELAIRARRYGIHQPTFRLPNGDLNPDSDIAVPGFNYAMNNIAATLGVAQLDCVKALIQRYHENGGYFDRALAKISGITLLQRLANSISAYWTYSLRAGRRMDLMRKLHENGIGAQRLHVRTDRYSCFSGARCADGLPGVDIFDRENLSIPCGWWVTAEDRERIATCIRSGW